MTHVKCFATNCAFNCDTSCALGDIHVGGDCARKCCDTCCDSFTESASFTNDAKCPREKTFIECAAEACAHNCNGECCAENVSIAAGRSTAGETHCETFVKK